MRCVYFSGAAGNFLIQSNISITTSKIVYKPFVINSFEMFSNFEM